MTIREKVLGPDHPDVAKTLENYAAMLKAAKRDAEAEPLLKRAAEIRAKVKAAGGTAGPPPVPH